MKFKVGDKARVLEAQYSFERVGDIITVTEVFDKYVIGIHPDSPNSKWSWNLRYIDKVEEPDPIAPYYLTTDDIIKENDKLKKQIKLLKIMLQAQGYESLAIASALELLN